MRRSFYIPMFLAAAFLVFGCSEKNAENQANGDRIEEFCMSMSAHEREIYAICEPYLDQNNDVREFCLNLSIPDRLLHDVCEPYREIEDNTETYCLSLSNEERKLVEKCAPYVDGESCIEFCNEGDFLCDYYVFRCARNPDGCLSWLREKTCQRGCLADSCMEDLPECQPINNAAADLVQVTDGDTIWLLLSGEKCEPTRYVIRVHGIDAPECSKVRNSSFYYECVDDAAFHNDNEPFGYESWVKAKQILTSVDSIVMTCDDPVSNGNCPFDDTGNRILAYLNIKRDGIVTDFGTELTRSGLAFSFTNFASSRRKQICEAQFLAQNEKIGVWSIAATFDAVMSKMGAAKRNWLKLNQQRCTDALK